MADGDNAILRSVPMQSPDGGMMRDGWGAEAMFPPMAGLSPRQHKRLSFVMVPPNLQLMFAPGAVSYTLLVPAGPEATFASSDRVTGGGWILPKSTVALPDFAERAASVRQRRGQDLGAGRAGQQRGAGRQALALHAARHLRPAGDDAGAVQCLAAALLSARVRAADAEAHAPRFRPSLHPQGGGCWKEEGAG
jgi:hypothetical protein